MKRTALELRNVTFSYSQRKLAFRRMRRRAVVPDSSAHCQVCNVSLSVPAGQAVSIIGFNGAGKSTLLRVASGLLAPNQGEVLHEGRIRYLSRDGLPFRPQLSGRENLELSASVLGLSKSGWNHAFDAAVQLANASGWVNARTQTWSPGMKARLSVAFFLQVPAEVLILDESLSGGDYSFLESFRRALKARLDAETTSILASHNLSLLAEVTSRTLIMRNGALVADGHPALVIPKYAPGWQPSE